MPDLGYQQLGGNSKSCTSSYRYCMCDGIYHGCSHTFVPIVTFRYSVVEPAEICLWVLRTIHSFSVVLLRCVTILCHGLWAAIRHTNLEFEVLG